MSDSITPFVPTYRRHQTCTEDHQHLHQRSNDGGKTSSTLEDPNAETTTRLVSTTTSTTPASSSSSKHPSRQEMDAIFAKCRNDQWDEVRKAVQKNPRVAVTPMIMDNHISTTIIHQAITSKGDVQKRSYAIQAVLTVRPDAAAIKNGYGSLPLHVIAQRNTKMTAEVKEQLIYALVKAYPQGLAEQGGVGRRTPIHVLFTDYISSRLTQLMIEACPEATFMKDKKGYLPAHVACSRHCSPQKLQVLLQANPSALYDTTNAGQTLLSLAESTATKSHPNFALIDALKNAMRQSPDPHQKSQQQQQQQQPAPKQQMQHKQQQAHSKAIMVKEQQVSPKKRQEEDGQVVVRCLRGGSSKSPPSGNHTRHLRSAALLRESANKKSNTSSIMCARTDLVVPMTSKRPSPGTPKIITAISTSTSTTSITTTKTPSPMTTTPTPTRLPSTPKKKRNRSTTNNATTPTTKDRAKPFSFQDDTTTPAAANLLLHFHRNGSPELKSPLFHQQHHQQQQRHEQELPSPTSHYAFASSLYYRPEPKRRKLIHSHSSIMNSVGDHETYWPQTRFAEV